MKSITSYTLKTYFLIHTKTLDIREFFLFGTIRKDLCILDTKVLSIVHLLDQIKLFLKA